MMIVENDRAGDLDALAGDEIRQTFVREGALVFRGFDVGPLEMLAFASRFSDRFNGNQERPSVDGTDESVHLVTEGMDYVEPHSEQANSPFRPDAIWFCCETPAAEGGETLLWDGVAAWATLSPSLRDLFERRRLRFFQRYPPDRWRQFLGLDTDLVSATRALDAADGASYFFGPDESIYLEYVCSARTRTKHGDDDAFVNSLLLEYATLRREGIEGQLMSFDNGDPVPGAVVDEVRATLNGIREEIRWEPGDLAMIDNTRYLHGRNAFSDRHRRMYSCCSFLNF
jgi:hypothetical protein